MSTKKGYEDMINKEGEVGASVGVMEEDRVGKAEKKSLRATEVHHDDLDA